MGEERSSSRNKPPKKRRGALYPSMRPLSRPFHGSIARRVSYALPVSRVSSACNSSEPQPARVPSKAGTDDAKRFSKDTLHSAGSNRAQVFFRGRTLSLKGCASRGPSPVLHAKLVEPDSESLAATRTMVGTSHNNYGVNYETKRPADLHNMALKKL